MSKTLLACVGSWLGFGVGEGRLKRVEGVVGVEESGW